MKAYIVLEYSTNRKMRFSAACLLLLLTNSVSHGFTTVEPYGRPIKPLLHVGSVQLNEAKESKDEYDDWYADFDPSEYQSYGNEYNNKSTSNSGHDYARDTSRDNSNVDLDEVNYLIAERLNYRKTGRFQEADAIRDDLLDKHSVMVFDKDRTWRSGASRSGSGSDFNRRGGGRGGRGGRDGGRGGRGGRGRGAPRNFGPNGHDYHLADDAGPNSSSFSEQEINELLAARLDCKLNRRYRDADDIQNQLNEAGVFVNDGSKQWRADGQAFEGFSPRRYNQSASSEETDSADEIQSLVGQRAKAKAERLFWKADEIRDTLRDDYDVWIDDRNQEWSVGGDFGRKNDRSFESFSMAPESERPEDHDEIQRLVEARDTARAERDFDTADQIRDDLMDRNIVIDDKRRLWAVGGFSRPRIEYSIAPGSPRPDNFEDIQNLVQRRSQARSERNFDEADDIRNELLEFDVVINDRARQWSVGGADRSKGFDSAFTRVGGGDVSEEDEDTILSLLDQRDEYKRDRKFKSADRIRDQLREEFYVGIDDRNREWHLVNAGYVKSAASAPVSEDVEAIIQGKIDERAQAKLDKDYDTADGIRDELVNEYSVSVDDRTKQWRVVIVEADADETVVDEVADVEAWGEEDENDDGEEEEEEDEMSGGDAQTYTEEELLVLTIPVLKEKLRDAGLPVSGKKSELVERLMGGLN